MDHDTRCALAHYCIETMRAYGQHEARVEEWTRRMADLSTSLTVAEVRPLAEALREVLLRQANIAHMLIRLVEHGEPLEPDEG